MAGKLIRIRYDGTCVDCSIALPARTEAWWERETKTLRCQTCGAADDEPEVAAELERGVAGESAGREYERLHSKREQRVRARHPRIGGFLLAVTEEPHSTRAWAKGAEGERKVGAGLDSLAPRGVITLHDRRLPGTKASNIDHLSVSPSGVWVIDAKRYGGQVEKLDVGGWFKTDLRLFVNRRDRTKLVDAMPRQVAAVRAALEPEWADVPVRPVLCFIDSEWGFFSKPFELKGVTVIWPKALNERLCAPGPYDAERMELIARRLAVALPGN